MIDGDWILRRNRILKKCLRSSELRVEALRQIKVQTNLDDLAYTIFPYRSYTGVGLGHTLTRIEYSCISIHILLSTFMPRSIVRHHQENKASLVAR